MFRPFRQWPAFFRANPSSRVQARHLRSARLRALAQLLPLEQLEGRDVPAVINLTVTSLADTGVGTLRSAITTADTGDPTDSYVINITTPGTITLESALPDLSHDITITGLPTVVGSAVRRDPRLATRFRIFTVDPGATVNLTGLTITGGNVGGGDGGGVDNSGTLAVSHCALVGNTAGHGGGLANEFGGTVTVSASTFTRNFAALGGGLFNQRGATATVSASAFAGNTAGAGGGLYNAGTATVSASAFTANTAGAGGGGLYNAGVLTVRSSAFTRNSAVLYGGGIYDVGTLLPSPPQSFNKFAGNTPDDVDGLQLRRRHR